MQILFERCDRCREEAEYLPGEVQVHFGGHSLGTKLYFDLCQECLNELRVFLHTPPKAAK